MIEQYLPNVTETVINMIRQETIATFYMVFTSTLFAYIIGMPVGMILILTDKNGILPVKWLNTTLNVIVNIMRSVPFLILAVTLFPFTRALIGSAIGATATIVPLTIGAAPFVARMVEQSLQEVDYGVVEAAQSMGVSPAKIIFKVMLPEAAPSLLIGLAITMTTVVGYSAMAGFVGGGGLGDVAVRYGHQRYQTDVMMVTLVLIVLIVQLIQEVGTRLAKRIDKRNIS